MLPVLLATSMPSNDLKVLMGGEGDYSLRLFYWIEAYDIAPPSNKRLKIGSLLSKSLFSWDKFQTTSEQLVSTGIFKTA